MVRGDIVARQLAVLQSIEKGEVVSNSREQDVDLLVMAETAAASIGSRQLFYSVIRAIATDSKWRKPASKQVLHLVYPPAGFRRSYL